MDGAVLHVLHAELGSGLQVADILRAMRHASSGETAHCVLLLCDLSSAAAQELPGDAPLLRSLQSGVMAMNARSRGEFHLLVRRRVWDDAARAYLGAERKTSCRETVARLAAGGETEEAFAAATLSPAALQSRFSYILFSELALCCTPDTPKRMVAALEHAGCGCLGAQVIEAKPFPQTALARLCAAAPFSLSPLHAAREDRLRRKGQYSADAPTLYTLKALAASLIEPPRSVPVAADCFFVRRQMPVLPAFFRKHRARCLHGGTLHALLPLAQLLLLFLSALTGLPWLTALALLPPELWALVHPRQLPGALTRLALLPLTALVSLDALLCRGLSRSRLLRLRVPDSLLTPQGCTLFGAVLLPVALHSAQALVSLLPVCLLWLAAPLVVPALDAPTMERIPLASNQIKQLRTMAGSAFFDSVNAPASPALGMLSACAGCMLGLLEPDEAARQAQTRLAALEDRPLAAHELSALLASAQFLRERMSDCDAALRELPAGIEQRALSLPLKPSSGRLGALLAAAKQAIPAPQALGQMARSGIPEPHDLLFLPMDSTRRTPVYPLSLPLTHPHTFLRRQLLEKNAPTFLPNPASRALFLAAAALGHPFHALLMRSPVTGPYMALFYA